MDWDKLMDPSLIEDECPIASDQYYEEADHGHTILFESLHSVMEERRGRTHRDHIFFFFIRCRYE